MGMSKKELYKLAGFKPGDRVRQTDTTYHSITGKKQQAEGTVLGVVNFTTASCGCIPSGVQVFVEFYKNADHLCGYPQQRCHHLPPRGLELVEE